MSLIGKKRSDLRAKVRRYDERMKYLLFLFVVPTLSHASFSKPELIARLSNTNAWNAPDNMWCFSSEPGVMAGKVHLSCFDGKGYLMARWDSKGFSEIARAESGLLFSNPISAFNKISWHEFHEWSAVRSYTSAGIVESRDIKNLGPLSEPNDNFLPYTSDSYFYRVKKESPELWVWKDNEAKKFFSPEAAFIYTPQVGPLGEIALKTRDNNYDEKSPDKLWHYNGEWKVILKDKDLDPASPWKTIRHQLAVEGDKVLALATDDKGEALILINNGKIEVIARAGVDLARFDYFAPKMRAGTIVVRGEDFQGNKAIYVRVEKSFRKLLTQGDVIQSDVGAAKVFYQSRDAIFYGAPGVDERGNVVLQATLTDPDHPATLLGIGIIRFNKE
jgi:hypothetical protein